MAISRSAQRVVSQLNVAEEEEEEVMLAVDNLARSTEKGDDRKVQEAKKAVEKIVKKSKNLKMKDVEKALNKAGISQ